MLWLVLGCGPLEIDYAYIHCSEDERVPLYRDEDGDDYGTGPAEALCPGTPGYADRDGDCDDTDPDQRPGALWYLDKDEDGFFDEDTPEEQCERPERGQLEPGEDCIDSNPDAWPGAPELCDGLDNDCDGFIDDNDAIDGTIWYEDADGDGWGEASTEVLRCQEPFGHVEIAGDCDDSRAEVHPDMDELCDELDNDCDEAIDEEPPEGTEAWVDADGDGYGDARSEPEARCPEDHEAINGLDCDDTDPSAWGLTDWYEDADGDGYGDDDSRWPTCDSPYTQGSISPGDCLDSDASVNPAAEEICGDGLDNDCDEATACGWDTSPAAHEAEETLEIYFARSWVRAGDLDGDGTEDLALGQAGPGEVQLWTEQGSTLMDSWTSTRATNLGVVLLTPDLDGDGDEDFVVTDPNDDGQSNGRVWYYESPTATRALGYLEGEYRDYLGGKYQALEIADINGDGDAELFWSPGDTYQFDGPLVALESTTEYAASSGTNSVYLFAADWNGDGVDELASAADRDIHLYEDSIASPVATLSDVRTSSTFAAPPRAGDLNGDGHLELLVAGEKSALVAPDPHSEPAVADCWTVQSEVSGDGGGSGLLAIDHDGDGQQDLLASAPESDDPGVNAGRVYLLLGPLSGTLDLAEADLIRTGSSLSGLGQSLGSLGDADGDGTEDFGASDRDEQLFLFLTPEGE